MKNNQVYLNSLERELKYRNYSPRTIEVYSTCIKYFLEKINKNPENINRDEIIDFVIFLQSQNKAPKTINLYKEAVKFLFREVLKIETEIDIKLSREAKKLPIILTNTEIKKIIESIKNEKHKFIISLTY